MSFYSITTVARLLGSLCNRIWWCRIPTQGGEAQSYLYIRDWKPQLPADRHKKRL